MVTTINPFLMHIHYTLKHWNILQKNSRWSKYVQLYVYGRSEWNGKQIAKKWKWSSNWIKYVRQAVWTTRNATPLYFCQDSQDSDSHKEANIKLGSPVQCTSIYEYLRVVPVCRQRYPVMWSRVFIQIVCNEPWKVVAKNGFLAHSWSLTYHSIMQYARNSNSGTVQYAWTEILQSRSCSIAISLDIMLVAHDVAV